MAPRSLVLAALAAASVAAAPVPAAPAAPAPAGAGDQTAYDPVTAEELLEHVEVLAADALMGRAAGTKGEHLAADYITMVLEEIDGIVPGGDDGTWFQEFKLPGPEQTIARNIIALLPGSDETLAEQTIIVGAHYDHVGRGKNQPGAFDGNQIHNGADDNASGTAGVLELAEALATSPQRPRRTISFQFYSGEVLGLLGSVFYTRNALRPLEDTILMINMDMIGRLTHDALLVGGTGTAPGFSALCREAVEAAGIDMIEEPVGGAPSDNASFHVAGVPALFLFTGGAAHRAGS